MSELQNSNKNSEIDDHDGIHEKKGSTRILNKVRGRPGRKLSPANVIEIIKYYKNPKKSELFESENEEKIRLFAYDLRYESLITIEEYSDEKSNIELEIQLNEIKNKDTSSLESRLKRLKERIITDEQINFLQREVQALTDREWAKIQASIRQTRKRTADRRAGIKLKGLTVSREIHDELLYLKHNLNKEHYIHEELFKLMIECTSLCCIVINNPNDYFKHPLFNKIKDEIKA